MKKLFYEKECTTCAYDKYRGTGLPSSRCTDDRQYRPKWYLCILGKLIAGMLVLALLIGGTAQAAEPAEDTPDTAHTMEVTVEDITAVSARLSAMDAEVDMLARLVWAEARGVDSTMEQAAVIWCVLNRVDAECWAGDIEGVVTARSQFAYRSSAPVTDELRALAVDVITRWLLEARGVSDVGRVLPTEYVYFAGRGGRNWFRDAYSGGTYWDWSLPDPYESEGEQNG